MVPWTKSGDNIDLFPEGFLWERGCVITRGDDLTVRTPAGRELQVLMWGNMPYVKKDKLQQILADLPEHHEVGRNGRPAQAPKAARVAYVKVDLDHLKCEVSPKDLAKIRSKYRPLPDLYWQDDVDRMITPDRFEEMGRRVVLQPRAGRYESQGNKRLGHAPSTD